MVLRVPGMEKQRTNSGPFMESTRKHSIYPFNAAIHALRLRVERTFAWEDKFKRLLLRFERIQQRHYGMKLMAYTLINLRAFCGA
jgi:transposase